MEKSQAETIADAILWPDPKVREETRRKKARREWWFKERRKVAWLMLIGFPVGAVIALYADYDVISGGIWGSIGGGSLAWLWIGWLWSKHQRAA